MQISDSVLASAPVWQGPLVRSRRRACGSPRLTHLANDEEARKKSKHVLEGDHGGWCGVVFDGGSKGKREARASEGYEHLQARIVDVAADQWCRTANAAGQGQEQSPTKVSAHAAAIGGQLAKVRGTIPQYDYSQEGKRRRR